jgi:carbon monoxide dehydrogenase subunit G
VAHYQASVDTERSQDEVFAYLSDFANTAEWDPGIDRAGKITPGAIDLGTAFRVVSKAMGQEIPFTYRVTEYDAPRSICLVGESSAIVSRDRMTFEQVESGTRVTYEADLSLKGVFTLAEPALRLGFKRVGDRALDGLKRKLSAPKALA